MTMILMMLGMGMVLLGKVVWEMRLWMVVLGMMLRSVVLTAKSEDTGVVATGADDNHQQLNMKTGPEVFCAVFHVFFNSCHLFIES